MLGLGLEISHVSAMAKHFEMSDHSLRLLEQIINNISASPEVAYCPVLHNTEGRLCIFSNTEKSK